MNNNRPQELNDFIEKAAEQNDVKIAAALEKIEDPKSWGSLKPTVSAISKLTDLSRNTIRNRQWALDRLKSIKQKRKDASKIKVGTDASNSDANEIALPEKLRSRIKALLEQNVLLYQEVIALQQFIRRKDLEINTLKISRRS